MSIVGVEKGLSSVEKYLIQQGYDVKQYDEMLNGRINSFDTYDVVVVTGLSENVMGVDEATTSVPIVNAKGLTLKQVRNQVDEKLGYRI